MEGRQSIFVGRKGTGKTANLLVMAQALNEEARTHVCVIKPEGYEVEGILRMLKQALPLSEKGYLVESLWKFLIYTELASSIANDLQRAPAYYQPNDAERDLLTFITQNADMIHPPFSSRLQTAVESLLDIEQLRPGNDQRARVSERLHDRIIRELRDLLGRVLSTRRKVAVLVDNLDKGWGRKEDVIYLASLIWGLLAVSGRIREEFEATNRRRHPVNLVITVFLRSDIYSVIEEHAEERDKLLPERIVWNDKELLIRVVDERISYYFQGHTPDEIWGSYFAATVKGLPAKDFITMFAIPRPRDVILFLQSAISDAVDRGHMTVEEQDFISARRTYSQFAVSALIEEDDPNLGRLEEVLYEFAGAPERLTREQVLQRIRRIGLRSDEAARYANLLVELGFLGIRTPSGQYEFPSDDRRRKILMKIAQDEESRRDDLGIFAISRPYHDFLGIVPAPPNTLGNLQPLDYW
jgi:hypothetical protein